MKFHQTYYTSCTVGLRGGKGFQFNAASPGIETRVLELVERLCLYIPPASAPTRPGPDELSQFPLSLFFYRLPDGRALLGQAKYLGTDYTGRFGNYFGHTLITTEAQPDAERFLPVELWHSPSWVATESTETALSLAEDPRTGGDISPARVQEFLHEGNRLSHMEAMLAAAEEALRSRRRLVLVDVNESIALWIAAISYALPRRFAWLLTFTTYAKNPYQTDALVTGTTPDGDFRFAPYEIEHQFSVFDYVGNRFSQLLPTPFSRSVAKAYCDGRAAEVADFGRFTDTVAPDLRVEELAVAFACHALICGLGHQEWDRAELVRWCAHRASLLKPEHVLNVMDHLVRGWTGEPEVLEAFAVLYQAVINRDSDPAVRSIVEERYLACLIRGAESVDLAFLSRAVQAVPYSEAPPEGTVPLRSVWFEQVRRMRDAVRICLLLSLGDRLGILADHGDVIRGIADRIIGPSLLVPAVQQAVLGMIDRPLGRWTLDGIGSYLESRGTDFGTLRSFLLHPPVFEVLDDYSCRHGAIGLHFRLLASKSAEPPGSRHLLLRQCLDEAKRLGAELTPARLETAFDAAWAGSVPSLREAIEIADMVALDLLARTCIPARLVDALVDGIDLRRDEPQRKELLERLQQAPLSDALKGGNNLIEICAIAERLRSRQYEAGPALLAALSVVRQVEEPLRSGIVDLMAERLSEITDADSHGEFLVASVKECGDEFLRAYTRRFQDVLSRQDCPTPETVAWMFRIWTRAAPLLGPAGNQLVASVLFKSLKKWRQPDFERVALLFNEDPAVLESWRQHIAHLPDSGFLGRISRWFVSSLFITFGTFAAVSFRLPSVGIRSEPGVTRVFTVTSECGRSTALNDRMARRNNGTGGPAK